MNGTLKEFKEKVAAKVGVSKECAHHVEMHLSGYELEPDTKVIRDFTELCEAIACSCSNNEGLTPACLAWTQDSEIELQGVEKAKQALVTTLQL